MPQRYFTTLIVIIALFVSQEVYSQTPTVVKSDSIVAVPIANIGAETEKTLSVIREMRSTVEASDRELELDSLVPLKLESIAEIKKSLDLEELEKMNLRQSEVQKNDFTQMRTQLDDWRKSYTNKTEEINDLKTELNNHKKLWETTLEVKREEALPQQVNERIESNLKNVNELLKLLSDRNNILLIKQGELTDALIYIDEVLNVINKTETSLKLQIYTIDSPPIWQMFKMEQDTIPFKVKINNSIEEHNTKFDAFKENYSTSIYFHIGFFALLVFLLFYVKNDVSKWSDERKDDSIVHSLLIISRPILSALLVSILFTRAFYPEAPEDVLDIYYLMLVFPILTVLPGLIPSLQKKYFYFIGGVFVLAQTADYFSALVILDRLILITNDFVTVILIFVLLRTRKNAVEKDPNIKWGFVFTILRASALFLIVSIVANTLGNTILSKILSQGTLAMIYGGILIYASNLTLKSLFALLIQHDKVSQLNMIQNYPDEVKHHIFRAIGWAGALFWLYLSLSAFTIYEPVYDWFESILTTEWGPGDVKLSAGNILAFFLTLWISLTVSKFIRFLLQDEILTHFEMPRGVPGAISMIVRLVLIALGFILAFGAAKIDMSNITIIFGALGVGIGFGLQNIFNNLVSGLILAFERPIQTGDIIQISSLNLMGEVKEIGIRASIVRTFDGAEVVVPNGNLISNEMINWTLSDHRRRQEIIVGVAYGTDINKVLEILNEVVPGQDNILKNPAPLIIFIGFGESSLDFRVLFWTHFNNGLGTKSRVGIAIDEAFKKAKIEIPFPQRDLHLRSVDDHIDFVKEKKPVRKPATKKAATTPKKESK